VAREHGLAIGAIQLGVDPVSQDEGVRRAAQQEAMGVIERASRQGVKRAMIMHRRLPDVSVEESIDLFAAAWNPVAEFAEDHNVKLVMEIYHGHGQWLAVTPELIRAVFQAVPSPALGICLDPSHLVVQGIDYMRATYEFGSRIHYAHAKDTEIMDEQLYDYGIFGRALDNPRNTPFVGWWRYRLPGYGQINWPQFISALIEVGYDDVLAIEHEDQVWYGDPELNKRGLLLAKQFLEPYMG
jgi:sugar phosphate isomerase/epimerase